ncbi:MAG: hypothetical protein ABID54_04940 [Pseudomonadota bacterium]
MGEEKANMLSDKDIAIYALHLLGGWQKRVHTEDVALKCYELAPSKFSWVKYPQYPDSTPARFALEAAKKQEYGALVKGESERKRTSKNIGGWMLTANGIEWVKANKGRIEEYLGKQVPTGDRLAADRKLRELIESAAFKNFRDRGEQAEISHADFAESLVCTINTTVEVLNDRLEQLYSIAEELKREDVKSYINFCRKRFASLLG